ncbi:uncharacterized protein zgc:112980 isoform X1 [Ictalurus punctatus]|uniref:Uncharacterized protein zgc:112980 isoform X1 n=1 Tax=Ictalurus punctatus TaxID=7998 RepID=A0A2D0Q7F4_ICTPU|nr:uncharacterized protein zgc:112980 isoform X1 [Ictalurus punctatus]
MDPSIEVIVLSDDDDAGGDHTGALDSSSVLIVEENEESKDLPETNEILDEDVTITFSRRASVLPHARYDCDKVFSFADSNISEPEGGNAAYCEQCFCYICDRLASQCKFWTVSGFCHCNAHKRSVYWKSLRDTRIMGYLHELKFTFDPADMDSDLRRAETSLQEFAHSLALKYGAFSMATENPTRQIACGCPCHSTNSKAGESSSANRSAAGCSRCYVEHQKLVLFDYTPVMACVCAFLEEATKETPKTGCIMALGAIKLFITHSAPGTVHAPALSHVALGMFWRAMSMVQVLLVNVDFPASFVNQLQHFLQILPLPPDLRKFKNGLNVLSWDDPLLSAVLKGQNVTGVRQVKGRRTETLHEALLVVRTRVLKLQEQDRYRELVRYLKVVKSDDDTILQMMRDWVPLYLCKVADYAGATDCLLSPKYGSSCPASRLSPAQFCAYLRIFASGHAPLDIPHPPRVEPGPYSQNIHTVQTDPLLSSTWTAIEGGSNLLKRQEVMKFALRVLNCNSAVFAHAESWIKVLEFANLSSSPSCLPEPNYIFLSRTMDIATGILNELNRTSRIQIPKNFQNGYPNQALLLLATQALAWRLLHSQLKPIVSVILTFKSNPWVVPWLFSSLLVQPPTLQDLFCVILEELADGQCRSILQIQDTAEQYFIASFLCLFFLESRVVLNHYTYPVTDLLAKWNEFENPWQYHLRRLLEVKVRTLYYACTENISRTRQISALISDYSTR